MSHCHRCYHRHLSSAASFLSGPVSFWTHFLSPVNCPNPSDELILSQVRLKLAYLGLGLAATGLFVVVPVNKGSKRQRLAIDWTWLCLQHATTVHHSHVSQHKISDI